MLSMPKLSMREIRRNPAVITEPSDLQPGLNVALCYLVPPIGGGMRCAQALMGLMAESETASLWERMKRGYRYTPAWGIVVDSVTTVNWINATNPASEHPYASFRVTQSSDDLPVEEKLRNLATSIAEVEARIHEVPQVATLNSQGDIVSEFEYIAGFENIGLAPEPYGLGKFVLDLSK